MSKKLTVRAIIFFLGVDLLFVPVVSLAYATTLSVTSNVVYSVLAGCLLLKCGIWASLLTVHLKPYTIYSQAREGHKSALVTAADRALQTFPLQFSVSYSATWTFNFGLAYAILLALGPEQVPLGPGSVYAVAIVMVAVWFGSFAVAFPLSSMLVADAAGECSVRAREHRVPLDRATTTLQSRLGLIAIALGLGPLLFVSAVGYMKQAEASTAQAQLGAALAAHELALDPSLQTPAGQAAATEGTRFILDSGGQFQIGNADARRAFESPSVSTQLTAERLAAPTGLATTTDDRALAHRRLEDGRVAVAVLDRPPGPTSSFAMSAGIFCLAVLLWAPLCAFVLGRAVSGPIERLTSAAQDIVEEGRQSEMGSLPVPRNDEVGVLSERFNDLLDMMRDLSSAADCIARGDLQVTIERNGELPDAFRGMLVGLRTMVTQLRETAIDLAGAATEIFAASQEQEAAATSQSSAMEEINRTMDSLSESAAHVSNSVQGVLSNAEQTLQNTDEMVERIGLLSAHAGRIAEILDVIKEVADKSDLLALNGSLEASRAGEGGQGFALVAAEMRRLAVRVTASVEDVKKLVADIKDSGSSTVMATEQSKRLAESTTDAARQITFVTQQQRSGTEQVSQSVKNITDVVSQVVSATAQTRSSAEGLKIQADKLSQLVSRFEVSSPRPPTSQAA